MIPSNSTLSESSNTSSSMSSTEMLDNPLQLILPGQHDPLDGDYSSLSLTERDDKYWERRRKNNAAAKRSRERRRQHDIAMEQQIQQLRIANSILQKEVAELKRKLNSPMLTERDEKFSPDYNIFQFDKVILSKLFNRSMSMNVPYALEERRESEIVNPVIAHAKYVKDDSNPLSNLAYTPLDLTNKSPDISTCSFSTRAPHVKAFCKATSSVTMDQRYWDRRRRNNEAVRRCRQNKKARLLNSVKVEPTIPTIDLMVSPNFENIISNVSITEAGNENINYREVVQKSPTELTSELKSVELVQDSCKKPIKWKQRLMEAENRRF